jgi:hypothetical protein
VDAAGLKLSLNEDALAANDEVSHVILSSRTSERSERVSGSAFRTMWLATLQ